MIMAGYYSLTFLLLDAFYDVLFLVLHNTLKNYSIVPKYALQEPYTDMVCISPGIIPFTGGLVQEEYWMIILG